MAHVCPSGIPTGHKMVRQKIRKASNSSPGAGARRRSTGSLFQRDSSQLLGITSKEAPSQILT